MGVRSTNTTQSFGSDFYRSGTDAADPYVPREPIYGDELFSTHLHEGNASTLTVHNGVDLSTHGGLVWFKNRGTDGGWNRVMSLFDSTRNNSSRLRTTETGPEQDLGTNYQIGYTTDGFTFPPGDGDIHETGFGDFVSWSFRKSPGFFDIVNYNGNSYFSNNAGRVLDHNLGCKVGFAIFKMYNHGGTNITTDWYVWHKSFGISQSILKLNNTDSLSTTTAHNSIFYGGNGTNTSTQFGNLGPYDHINETGKKYVAYLFADGDDTDAQIFGSGRNESMIKTGGYNGNGSATGPEIDLGWEPQWLLIRCSERSNSNGSGWYILDVMRGIAYGGSVEGVQTQETNAEATETNIKVDLLPTGFRMMGNNIMNENGGTYIYVAIRRPFKQPTDASDVFNRSVVSGGAGAQVGMGGYGWPIDLQIHKDDFISTNGMVWAQRIRGVNTTDTESSRPALRSSSADGAASLAATRYWNSSGFKMPSANANAQGAYYNFRRAPGFFDIVNYEGTSTGSRVINHQLGVVPEMIITKNVTNTAIWDIRHKDLTAPGALTSWSSRLRLPNDNGEQSSGSMTTIPTSTTFEWDYHYIENNNSGNSYISYLFATLPGISKVGSYGGTGSAQNIDCGFTNGASFILIKRIDTTANWYVYDSSMGIGSGDDPFLRLNTTDTRQTSTNYVDYYANGFKLTDGAIGDLNSSDGTYIYLAIA